MKRWKWISALVICGVVATAAMRLQAEVAVPRTRATVVVACDIRQIFRDYLKAKDLMAEMRKRQDALQIEAKSRQVGIDSKQKVLSGFTAGSPKYKKAHTDLQTNILDREVWTRLQEQTLMQDHILQTKRMRGEIIKVITTLSTQRRFDIVVQMNADDGEARTPQELIAQIANKKVLYASGEVNITPMVIAALNRAYTPR
jgi:hypothetical protein